MSLKLIISTVLANMMELNIKLQNLSKVYPMYIYLINFLINICCAMYYIGWFMNYIYSLYYMANLDISESSREFWWYLECKVWYLIRV